MEISTTIIDKVVKELSVNHVHFKYAKGKKEIGFVLIDPWDDSIQIIDQKGAINNELQVLSSYKPFSATLNNTFINEAKNPLLPNSEYNKHLNELKENLIQEIDNNIKLRLGKWDILDYLNNTIFKLESISSNIEERGYKPRHLDRMEYHNHSAIYTDNDNRSYLGDQYAYYSTSMFWEPQKKFVESVLSYIKVRVKVIESTDDYVKAISDLPVHNNRITWTKTDTDLLELITALVESKSIQNSTKSLTRKEAIELFSQFFNLNIKDAESKLTRATNRKKDVASFLTSLKETFEDYSQRKDERLDELRK